MSIKHDDKKRAIKSLEILTDGLQFRFNVSGIVVPNNQFDIAYTLHVDGDRFQFNLKPTKSRLVKYGKFKESNLNTIIRKIKEKYQLSYLHEKDYDVRMLLLDEINDVESDTFELRVLHQNIESIEPSFRKDGKIQQITINVCGGAKIQLFDFEDYEPYEMREKDEME